MKGAKKLGFSFNVRTPTSVIINAVNNRLKNIFFEYMLLATKIVVLLISIHV